MLTIGKILMPQMRRPVASMITPPHAEKSASIVGVARGISEFAPKWSALWIASWGTAIRATA